METRWGLDLDMSAVRLMRQDDEAWVEVAVERIDGPDIEDRLVAMIGQIDPGAAVHLFLPRDQILYTQVNLGPVGDTRAQIERAMDGRTPYTLDELAIDWELSASGVASVAAIAHETLDEAAAFAEVRGLGVSGYSSLEVLDDFPRLPRFKGALIPSATAAIEPTQKPKADAPSRDPAEDVQFVTARKPSRPPGNLVEAKADIPTPAPEKTPDPAQIPEPSTATTKAAENDEVPVEVEVETPKEPARPVLTLERTKPEPAEVPDGPVVHVDDSTPVMAVKSPQQPLNPGIPVSAPTAPPRVRTDIAASTVSGSAASLTPPTRSVKVRRGGSFAATAMVFAAVFLVTIGIATLAWVLLPLSPGRTSQSMPPVAETGQQIGVDAPETAIAALPEANPIAEPETPDPQVATEDAPSDVAPTPEAEQIAEPAVPEVPTDTEIAETVDPDTESEPEVLVEEVTPEIPDLPQPIALIELASAEPPALDAAPSLAAGVDTQPGVSTPLSLAALPSGEGLPAYDPAAPLPTTPSAFAGILTTAPFPGPDPESVASTEDVYIASIETSELASDAIALPSIFGLAADDVPSIQPAPVEGAETDEPVVAALVPEDRVVPADAIDDAMAAAVEEALADALAGPGGLVPTKLASAIPDRAPRARPGGFVEDIERDQFGGRTRGELAGLRPPPRPESVQAAAAEPTAPPSALAVASSFAPRGRPQNFASLVSAALVQREAEQLSASVNTSAPDTSSAIEAALNTEPDTPRQSQRLNIPTTASVARAATVENAIRLNKVNLVGVYGAVSDRRALVRLPSGRYVKVKVGDRVDGGTVAQITDSQLLYRKGNRTLALSMPQG